MLVEDAAEHEAHRLRAGLNREPPGRSNKHRMGFRVIPEIDVHDRGMRFGRMKIDRNVERNGPLENRPIALVIEKRPFRQAVNHRPLESELGHGPFQLVGRRRGIRRRQRREAREALRVILDRREKPIVRGRRPRDRDIFAQSLRAG
jgi:hypothetical protein